jgi:hypothetical protein
MRNDGLLSLDKVGLFTNATAISGPLIVGGTDIAKSPQTLLFANEEIATDRFGDRESQWPIATRRSSPDPWRPWPSTAGSWIAAHLAC